MPIQPFRTVIVPVDFSDDSKRSIEGALNFVETPDALHIVHVLFPLDYMSPGVTYGTSLDADRRKAVDENMRSVIEAANAKGAKPVVLVGDPGLKVADYARENSADLIVIPSHGYHGVKRLLLGSTTERIIRHAECSVFVLRRQDAE